MNSPLRTAYPSLRLDHVCRVCRGRPSNVLDKFRCPVCRRSNKEYYAYSAEIEEIQALWLVWLDCKLEKRTTSGVKKKDLIITLLFGVPHNDNWRNYDIIPLTETSASRYIVVRLT